MEAKPNNLNTFRILFLVKGIITLCFSVFFILYAGMGFFFNAAIEHSSENPELPFNFGWFFVIIGGLGVIICIVLGILTLLASKYLKEVKNYNFIFVIAILNVLTGILGILLGVFTLIELTKPEVKKLFGK
ncbi:hypothetical protein [Jejuia pallidilutea]|uniref:Uncharacterized protein n=1 Tax=Jejuia pallidilutea TaxID=504487 RepID=A0A090W4U6_9FLAO|nr:hypothetical protein [Jejuia pallidilutea]PQV47388.1 hypothetical protein CLV33_107173 [Jejuia pallidilutea]GAL67469.1 hypothetical protein JCM19301_442 [Jejuia pallidilutea]GAL71268.1 hypothetical protein JCM19302_945 [Jejuia pallidilutea]GAL88751.1 hypothetical protein JCM19538_1186 [Jejuia pallidilutea]